MTASDLRAESKAKAEAQAEALAEELLNQFSPSDARAVARYLRADLNPRRQRAREISNKLLGDHRDQPAYRGDVVRHLRDELLRRRAPWWRRPLPVLGTIASTVIAGVLVSLAVGVIRGGDGDPSSTATTMTTTAITRGNASGTISKPPRDAGCPRSAKDAEQLIGSDLTLHRLDPKTDACAFARTGEVATPAHAKCPVGWVCQWEVKGKQQVVLGADQAVPVFAGTWRRSEDYPPGDPVRDDFCGFVKKVRAATPGIKTEAVGKSC